MTFRYPLMALLLAGAALAPPQPAAQDAARCRPGPPASRIKAIETTPVADLTGPGAPCDQRPADVRGTDLGIMAEVGDRIFFLFGGTFGYDETGYLGPGGSN